MGIFSNNENERKSFEEKIDQLRNDYEALNEEKKAKEEEIAQLKKINEALREALEAQGDTPNEVPVPESDPTPEPCKPEVQVQVVDCTPALEALATTLKELKAQSDEIKVQVSRRDIQDENVRDMHKELERFRGDFYAKITQPYLMALLELHKRFYNTYTHFDHLDNGDADLTQLYNDLMKEFKIAVQAVADQIYNDFGVEYFEPAVNADFDRREHQVMNMIDTTDAELHHKVAKVFYGGFRNIDTDKILRPARIDCYRLIETKE